MEVLRKTLAPSSASRRAGLDEELEAGQLVFCACLIEEAGYLLRLPRTTISAGQALFHRFYVPASLRDHSHVWAACAALLIATKVEETPRLIREIATTVHHCLAPDVDPENDKHGSGTEPLDYYGPLGYEWKASILDAERQMMSYLGFRVTYDHPHKYVLVFMNTLREKAGCDAWTGQEGVIWRKMLQVAWNYANDAHRAQIVAIVNAETVACACIGLAAQDGAVLLPDGWQAAFGASPEDCSVLGDVIGIVSSGLERAPRFEDVSGSGIAKLVRP